MAWPVLANADISTFEPSALESSYKVSETRSSATV